MKVKFTQPVKVVGTRFAPGDVVDVSDEIGKMLVKQSLAEAAPAEAEATKTVAAKTAKAKKG